MNVKTIIIGGGMAGLSCALQLQDAGEEFLLITDSLGGRIQYCPEENINYGAYFVMDNYKNAKKLVGKGPIISPLNACFHNNDKQRFAVISYHTLTLIPELLRFYVAMQEFRKHYELFKKRCTVMPQKEAMKRDPYILSLFNQPAKDYFEGKRFQNAASDFISKFTYACTGAAIEKLTALDAMNVSMGILIPIRHLRFDQNAIKEKLKENLVFDSIQKLNFANGFHTLIGKSGQTYQAKNVVIATQASVTQQLLEISDIREASVLYAFHISAELKQPYRKYELNLFPSTSNLVLTARQLDGSYLLYSRIKDPDFSEVCVSFKILKTHTWEKAMYIHGDAYLEQQVDQGLYVAGDHNGLGLEPTAISGIFAANQIIEKNNL